MNAIRPVSDLQDCLDDIVQTVHETGRPVFLTKDGYGDHSCPKQEIRM